MIPINPISYLAEALVRAGEYKRPRTPPAGGSSVVPAYPSGEAFSIAISREVGAGGTDVAREVASRLGWPLYDHELLAEIARDLKVNVHLVESVDERHGNWLQECVEAFAAVPSVTEVIYFRRLLRMLLSLGARGECVVVGRGASYVMPPARTLRVRLVAYRDDRIDNLARSQGLSRTEAERLMEQRERERTRFIREHFQRDVSDLTGYDLVLNSSRFSQDSCADLVLGALAHLQRGVARTPVQPSLVKA